jgi:shikimate kinase
MALDTRRIVSEFIIFQSRTYMSETANDFTSLPAGEARPLCLTLIGMAAAGKSMIGRALAGLLGWMHVDTDRLLEAHFGAGLQDVRERLGIEGFLRAEEQLTSELFLNRCVISTGGSVVYGERAMVRLRSLGPVVLLETEFRVIEQRLSDYSTRGLVIRSGQTIRDLFEERKPLYLKYADHVVTTDEGTPEEIARRIIDLLGKELSREGIAV